MRHPIKGFTHALEKKVGMHNYYFGTHSNTSSHIISFYPRDNMLVCHTPVLCLAERKQDREMYTF